MAETIGRNRNTNTDAVVSDGVTMTAGATAETIASVNLQRISFSVVVAGFDAWIRFIPASTDGSTRKGFFVPKGATFEMQADNIYTGEISIINALGATKPVYYTTEY